jgi:quinol monooxygenase YgiN
MFALVVRFDCRDEAAAARFDELTAAAVQQIAANEPGTLLYATHTVDGDPLARVFYEVYRDREAFDDHEAAEHVVRFHAEKDPLLAGTRVEFLAPGRLHRAGPSPQERRLTPSPSIVDSAKQLPPRLTRESHCARVSGALISLAGPL